MKTLMFGMALSLAASVGLAAQSATVKQKSEIEVKGGRDVTVTGCVRTAPSGTGYFLADVRGEHVTSKAYTLVGKDDELSEHVGQLVQIKGKAADVGNDGKVEVHTKTEVEREGADDKKAESSTQMKGSLAIPLLGVDDVKSLNRPCEEY